jgi:ADP-heptose:LPS heptosyltransferase
MIKKALVIRYGAWGDMIIASPLFRLLKQDGYQVTLNCNKRGAMIVKHNPNVDKILLHDETIPNETLGKHWAELSNGYDRVINLSESIEKGLLSIEGSPEFFKTKEERHDKCNVNYYDRTLEIGGYQNKGLKGELYFSPAEEYLFSDLRHKLIGKFKILWGLSGSSHHKAYPYGMIVGEAFLNKHPDAVIITVGDDLCRLLEWDHPRLIKKSGQWPIRKSLLMAKYANLVISGESAIANAAGCFDVPKIIMLSHSSEENLTKYWLNCISLHSTDAECYPCHQIHYTEESCPCDGKIVKGPVCMSTLWPESVFNAMEQAYERWENGIDIGQRQSGMVA